MAWKVLITDGLESVGKEIINKQDLAFDKKGVEAQELFDIIPEFDAIIIRGRTKITPELLDAATNLKVIGRMGVGVDNINLDAAKSHDITVVNAAVATSIAVAELTMGLMLSLVREIPRADASMKNEQWLKKDLVGTELNGKTLGVIGFGNIGRTVGKYASAFGMQVLAYDPFRDSNYIHSFGAVPASVDEIYEKSDILTFHIPLTDQCRHMINDEAFAKMKDGVLIVDAARGGIIDEQALLRALETGKVRGIGLDVYEKEPPVSWELIRHPHVVALPHIGAQTAEAQLRAAVDISTEVLNCLNGLPLRWKIC